VHCLDKLKRAVGEIVAITYKEYLFHIREF
jgi:hypothetical protein